MARAALRWGVRDVASRAGVAVATVANFEGGRSQPRRASLAAIQRAFEAAGIEFLKDGVRLKQD